MRPLHRSLLRGPAPLLMATALLFACETTGTTESTTALPAAGFENAPPADVAVAPVVDRTGRGDVPVGTLREALYEGLVGRLYSPLDLAFVDARWTEAGFAPSPQAHEALMQMVITGWDTELLESRDALVISADVRLVDAARPDALPLWAVSLRRRIDMARDRPRLGSGAALFEHAARTFAAEALALLPERDPARPAR